MKTLDKWDWLTAGGALAFWFGVYQIHSSAGWILGGIWLILYGIFEGRFGKKKEGE